MGRVLAVSELFGLALAAQLHGDHEARVSDFFLLINGQFCEAVVLGDRVANHLAERRVVAVQFLLLLVGEDLPRLHQDVLGAQVRDLGDAVVGEAFIPRLDPLHHVLLLAKGLDVLLADELKELAHLRGVGFGAALVVTAAGAVLIVLPVVGAEQVRNDRLHLRGQVPLGPDKLERPRAFLRNHLLDVVSDAVIVRLGIGLFNFALQVESFLNFSSTVFLDEKKLVLGESQLILENAVDYGKPVLFVEQVFIQVVSMPLLNVQVEKGGLLVRLVSEHVPSPFLGASIAPQSLLRKLLLLSFQLLFVLLDSLG